MSVRRAKILLCLLLRYTLQVHQVAYRPNTGTPVLSLLQQLEHRQTFHRITFSAHLSIILKLRVVEQNALCSHLKLLMTKRKYSWWIVEDEFRGFREEAAL